MIKSITVKNVKSHRDTRLDFCSGVNILVGRSQAGKSCFLQAFNWLRNNRPPGLGKKSWFSRPGAEMKVEIQTDEGNASLTKSTRGARYEVNGKPFRKFGTSVPDKVTELLNISDLNVQQQLDQHYLIISGPAEVARVINEVTGLENLDSALNWCASQINQRNATVQALEEQLTQRKKDFKAYKDVDIWDEKLAKIEKLFSEYQRIASRIEHLEEIIEEVEKIEQDIEELEEIDFGKCKRLMGEVEMILGEYEQMAATHRSVRRFTDELVKLQLALEKVKDELAKFKDEYRKQLRKLGKCPLCLSDIENRVDEIVENL